MTNKKILGTASLYVASLLWGTAFIPQKLLVTMNVPPFYTVGLRFASIAILLFFLPKIPISKTTIKRGALLGFFLFLAFFTQTVGLEKLDVSVSAFLTSTSIIFIPIINSVFFKGRISFLNILAVMSVMIGIFFFNYQSNIEFTWSRSILLTLASSLLFTLHIVFSEQFLAKGEQAIPIHVVQCLFTAVFSLSMAFFTESFPTTWSLTSVVSLLYLGLIASILCFGLLMFGQKNTNDPIKAGLIISLEPVWAFVFSVMWLSETISRTKIYGILFVALAIGLCEWQNIQYLKKKGD